MVMGLVSRPSRVPSRNSATSSGDDDDGPADTGPWRRSNKSPGVGFAGNVNISTGRLIGTVCAGNVLSSLLLFSLLRSLICQTFNHGLDYNDTSTSTHPAATSGVLRGSTANEVETESTKGINDIIWSDFTNNQMEQHLRCGEFYERQQQTIHDQDAWKEMRRNYVNIVGADASTVGPPELGYNGFSRPYYVDHSEHGRGIYAKDDIPKGSLVWHNIRSASFSEGSHFREFVMTLPRELGCDVLQWSYVMDQNIYCDLDEGSFCNNGDDSKDENIDLDETASAKFITKAGMQLFATRDIEKGEELVCNYASFASGRWSPFGL
mmetsp:Transcript_18300/g.30363  ORF Transcript_18300/g.30363 Transcript_18300/m.30363 type:complete len:322 (-) Transcript_18300:213-1178(-)